MEAKQYQELWMHREMLRDKIRCSAYREAVGQTVIPGQTVLDVGTGTGVLAVFAAQAGAKKVYAVERTDIAQMAEAVVKANGVADTVVVIQEDIERVHLPEMVDVILGEWMGGFGVDENLLGSVLVARDRWLKPGGRMVPGRVVAWLAPVCDESVVKMLDFWRSRPYGIDVSQIADHSVNEVHNANHHILPGSLLAEPMEMWINDMYNDAKELGQQPFTTDLSFEATREGKLSALAAWFSAELSPGVMLSNAPDAPRTHWGRTVLPVGLMPLVKQGTNVRVKLVCSPVSANLCHIEWSIRIDGGPWQYYSGRQGCTASPGFHMSSE